MTFPIQRFVEIVQSSNRVSSFLKGDQNSLVTFKRLPNLDQAIRGLLYLFVFSLPFSGLLLISRNGFIVLVAFLMIWCVVKRGHFFRRTPIDVPLAVLVLWVGITVPFSPLPAYSSGEFAKLLQQCVIFYGVVYFFQAPRPRQWMNMLLLGQLVLMSVYGLWQFDLSPTRSYPFIQSFCGSEVALTTYLLMNLPLAIAIGVYSRQLLLRRVGVGASLLAVLCQMLTFSRGGLTALFVEGIALAGMVRSRLMVMTVVVLLTISIALAGALFVIGSQNDLSFIPVKTKLTTYNLVSRFKAWQLGYEKILEHPLMGSGYGKNTFGLVTQANIRQEVDVATEAPMARGTHNTLLDISVGAGIPAGLAYLWLMWTIGRTGFVQFYAAQDPQRKVWSLTLVLMVVGLFVRNSFDHMWVGNLAAMFWVMVGLGIWPLRSEVTAEGVEGAASHQLCAR